MTTSRDPEKPSKGAKSGTRAKPRAPLSRRLRYLVQDTGHSIKKAGRRVADPVRDARPKRGASAAARAKPKTAAEPSAKPAGRRPVKPAGRRPAKPRDKPRSRAGTRPRPKAPGKPVAARRTARRPGGARRRSDRRRPKLNGAAIASSITNFGERASRLIRSALAPLAVPIVGLAKRGRGGLAWLERTVTPLRAAIAATALAAILLGISQFVDYRGVAVGVPDYAAYADAEVVAPAPQVARATAGSAHAYLLVPVALGALVALWLCARGRWQLGRIVSLLGLLGIAITLIVDVPAGLDESATAVAYAGVEAQLIEGFWAELVSAAVLVVGGLIVSRYARKSKRTRSRRRRRAAAVGPARASAA